METIKTTEYVPCTISVNVYTFEELGEAAQERVFDDWNDEERRQELYGIEVEEIDTALHSFLGLLGYPDRYGRNSGWYRYGNLDYIGFDPVDFYEAVEKGGPVDEYAGCGLWCGCDLAAAWNAGVDHLRELEEKCREADEYEQDEEPDEDGRRYGCYATMDAQGEYCAWFDKMLADVAAAYHKLVDDAFDYFYCGKGMREYWNDCCELETEGRHFFEDGEDATDVFRTVMLNGGRVC